MGNFFLSLLVFALIYLGFLIIWGVICLLAFSLSLVTKKQIFIVAVLGFNVVAMWLLGFGLGISILVYMFTLLFQGKIFGFVIMLFFGGGVASLFSSYLQVPFFLISNYFTDKIGEIERRPTIARAEIVDEKKKVIGILEGETDISRRVAKYFLLSYIVGLLYSLMRISDHPDWRWFDYLVLPVVWIGLWSAILGFFVGVYNLIRGRKFFHPRKKLFFIRMMKTYFIINIVVWVLATVVTWLYS